MSAWIPGIKWVQRWRGRNQPPQYDPNKSMLIFQPMFRLVKWEGYREGHIIEYCNCANLSESGQGFHEEIRPHGLLFEGVPFNSLEEAMDNQAFAAWYEEAGKEQVDASHVVVRPPQFRDGEEPPRPAYGFLIHEHAHEMTNAEIMRYKRDADIPGRFKIGRSP